MLYLTLYLKRLSPFAPCLSNPTYDTGADSMKVVCASIHLG